ncbi:MAG: hypothetical protein VB110_04500 [Bacteroidales bacterium]|jgi:hypothetical protein|nr:hypothetical protein [Bacteroidales bacterium]
MNKKVGLFILFLIASFSIGMQIDREGIQSDLTIATIEALATTENVDVNCFSIGSVDCPKSKEKVSYYY